MSIVIRPEDTFARGGDVVSGSLDAFLTSLPRWGSPDLSFRPSSLGEDAGKGVFATRAFGKGEPITRFDGLVVHSDGSGVVDPDAFHYTALLDAHCLYIQGDLEPTIGHGIGSLVNDTIDLPRSISANRIIRRSDKYTNAELKRVRTPAGLQAELAVEEECLEATQGAVILRALVPIAPGAEIFINYGDKYWTTVLRAERRKTAEDMPGSRKRTRMPLVFDIGQARGQKGDG